MDGRSGQDIDGESADGEENENGSVEHEEEQIKTAPDLKFERYCRRRVGRGRAVSPECREGARDPHNIISR